MHCHVLGLRGCHSNREALDFQLEFEAQWREASLSEGTGRKKGDRNYPRSVTVPAYWLSHQGVTWEGVWSSPGDSDEFEVISLSDSVRFSFFLLFICFFGLFSDLYLSSGRNWIENDRWKTLNSVWGLMVMGVFAEIRNGFECFCKCSIFVF